jgi:hypothetical protein
LSESILVSHLGIVTRYHYNEATQAALHLAERATSDGIKVSILASKPGKRIVSPYWDSRVVYRRTSLPAWRIDFVNFCSNLTHILFMGCPSQEEILFAKQATGLTVWVIPLWDELHVGHGDALAVCDGVLCPYPCVKAAIEQAWDYEMPLTTLSWDIHLASTRKYGQQGDVPRVLFPLHETQGGRTRQWIFEVINKLLETTDAVVIVSSGGGWSRGAKDTVKKLKKRHPKRIVHFVTPSFVERAEIFAHSDLTAWGSQFEGLATVGLESLYMGTPVVAWDINPQSTYLLHKKNAYLVGCEIRENWMGIPEVIPDQVRFLEAIQHLLQQEQLLTTMIKSAPAYLATRKRAFMQVWKKLWT